jgi:hypothetical protein
MLLNRGEKLWHVKVDVKEKAVRKAAVNKIRR